MKKVHNINIGNKYDLININNNWAVVHACKTSHQAKLGYKYPIKNSPNYINFRNNNHLYINWVDEPTGKYFQIETFIEALDFIDEHIKDKKIFIHCDQGESRAPTLGLVYLAKRTDYLEDDFEKALLKFKNEYSNFRPKGIINFIRSNWKNIK